MSQHTFINVLPNASGSFIPYPILAEKARKMRGMYAHVENDSGHVGTIHSKSIIDIVRLFGANPTPETARQIIKDIDISGDDACSFHELVSYFAGPGSEILSDKNTGWDVHHDSKREYWENLFKQFDTNADGRFSVKELSHLLRHMGDSPLSKQEVSDMFFGMDANSDGKEIYNKETCSHLSKGNCRLGLTTKYSVNHLVILFYTDL